MKLQDYVLNKPVKSGVPTFTCLSRQPAYDRSGWTAEIIQREIDPCEEVLIFGTGQTEEIPPISTRRDKQKVVGIIM